MNPNMLLCEEARPVLLLAPQTVVKNTNVDSGYINMKNVLKLAILVAVGAVVTSTVTVTLKQATSAAGANAKAVTITRHILSAANAPATDTLTKTATVNSAPTAVTKKFIEIDLNADQLDVNGGFTFLAVNVAVTDDNDAPVAAFAFLTAQRIESLDAAPSAFAV